MKLRVLAGLALGSLALTACASATPATTPAGSTTPSASQSGGAAGGTLTIWADDKRAAALKTAVAAFEKDKGVTVKIQAVSKDLQTNFVTASQAGNAPDIVVGAHDWIGNLVQNGAIAPVTLTDPAVFDAASIKAVTYQGQTYGVPYSRENIALIRNTDLAPTAPATLDDLVASGQALKAAGKTSEIMSVPVGQTGDAYHMQPLLAAGGGSFFGLTATGDPDAKNLTIDSAASVAAYEKIKAIGEAGSGAVKRSIGAENAIATFTSKKAAYLISGPWAIADIKKAGINYEITSIPTWKDGGKPATPFMGVNAFYVSAKGKNVALAQEFAANFVSTPELQVALYAADPRQPALIAASDQVKSQDPDLAKFAAAGKDALPMPSIPAMNEIWGPVGKAQASIVGGADVASTITAAAAAVKAKIG